MANARDIWDVFFDMLVNPCSREQVIAAFEKVGLRVEGGGAAVTDDDPPHELIVIGAPESEDSFFFAVVPEAEIDEPLRAALERCNNEQIDVGTAENFPDLWEAWTTIALATGAREREDLELAGEPVPLDAAAIQALTKRWDRHAFTAFGGRVDGARLDRNITHVTLVYDD